MGEKKLLVTAEPFDIAVNDFACTRDPVYCTFS